MRTITREQFLEELKKQGVPRDDLAFVCVACKTVQSMRSLMKVGVKREDVERYIGFSCVGRWTNAGPATKKVIAAGKGCDWTLGGLFSIHELEVEYEGKKQMHFEVATPEQAQALKKKHDDEEALHPHKGGPHDAL